MSLVAPEFASEVRELTLFQVMPRGMYFGVSKATSIDLCVRDLVHFSRFRDRTRIFCEHVEDPFAEMPVSALPEARRAATFRRANFIAAEARRLCPDIIVVQQHLPTAAAIALRAPGAPVILHTHNVQKTFDADAGLGAAIRRAARRFRYRQLAGIIHVSHACADAFNNAWPDADIPGCVVHNGLDFSAWRPATARDPEILYSGRCAPEKGVLELAHAVARVLPHHPGWRARFILSAAGAHPDYLACVRAALAGLGGRAEIQLQLPFAMVKAACERAAIAVVPSIYFEAFGRSALEAHAGRAAVITSGRGGLAEVSGDAAMLLPAPTEDYIAAALLRLISNEPIRAALASEGAERVRARFSLAEQARRFDAFCEQVAFGRQKRSRDAQPAE